MREIRTFPTSFPEPLNENVPKKEDIKRKLGELMVQLKVERKRLGHIFDEESIRHIQSQVLKRSTRTDESLLWDLVDSDSDKIGREPLWYQAMLYELRDRRLLANL